MLNSWLLILLLRDVAVGFGGVSVLLSRVLGPSNPTPEKMAPYECGMPPVGDARERQSIKFYVVAMIFLLFDIEVAFLYPWALALRSLGWGGYLRCCCSPQFSAPVTCMCGRKVRWIGAGISRSAIVDRRSS